LASMYSVTRSAKSSGKSYSVAAISLDVIAILGDDIGMGAIGAVGSLERESRFR
jgi:hypothetical protein